MTPRPAPRLIEAFGEKKTAYLWSEDPRCRVRYHVLVNRLTRGWSPEDAISVPSFRSAARLERQIEAFGERKSLEEWARDPRAHADGTLILWRIQRGWNPESAMTTPPVPRPEPKGTRSNAELYEGFGQTRTFAEWARDPRCRVSRATFRRNLSEMPVEEAFTYRRPRRSRITRTAESIEDGGSIDAPEALDLMAQGAELWKADAAEGLRISLFHQGERHSLAAETLDALIGEGKVRPIESFGGVVEYKLNRT